MKGKIIAVNGDEYSISWDSENGKTDDVVHKIADVRAVLDDGTVEFIVGTKVHCLYQNGNNYACTLVRFNTRGDGEEWEVKWADGDTNDTTGHPPSHFASVIEEAVRTYN